MSPRRPSAVTTVITGLLALAAGLYQLYLFWPYLEYPGYLDYQLDRPRAFTMQVALLVAGVALVAGPALLLMRRRAGRALLVSGGVLLVVTRLLAGFFDGGPFIWQQIDYYGAYPALVGWAAMLVASAAAILGVVPATSDYLRHDRAEQGELSSQW
ncbi:hypothetical protein GCM10010174_23020 [Kutzneria viridogrisea]|uniref:Uncharacterized protein n=2 Tax=Kutzneria TaxID=43356 RepID=W5W070_9PSEU|nr:hypothetical protein [Kutzneria albida]AHH94217.1 hypothetical protein KALB_843 [Kutzneria albida DSM 43870]MBA8929890.1 hypothetical protein [Kutzneria viridogrisea]